MIKKVTVMLLAVCMMFVMTACSFGGKTFTEDTIVIGKKGTVEGVIVEEFDKDYYNQDELNQMITDEISAYNGGGEAVTLEKFEMTEDNKVYVSINYQTPADYKEFNEKELFVGTVLDAYNAGYTFVDMAAVGEGSGLGAEEILENGSLKLVIFEEPVCVRVSGKIAYVSENVTNIDKKEAKAQGEGLFYIIYE